MNLLGYDSKDLFKRASKTLIAGFLGVAVGSILQPIFIDAGVNSTIITYWMAAFCGFIVNFSFQVKVRNIPVKKAE